MKTFAASFTGKDFGIIKAYPSRSLALKDGNGFTIFSDESDLLKKEALTLSQMVVFYNHHNSAQPVKKFSDRAVAAKRIFNLAQAKAEKVEMPNIAPTNETVRETMENLKTAKAAKVKAEKKTAAKRGRKSEFAGVKIFPAEGLKENPRREGGFGYKAMAFIMANPGVSYEDFVEAGGRRQDLAWDIAKGNVTIQN